MNAPDRAASNPPNESHRQALGSGIAFLSCGIAFLGVGLGTRMAAMLLMVPPMLVLGIIFLARARRRPHEGGQA